MQIEGSKHMLAYCMSLDKRLFNLTNLNFFGLGQTSAHVIVEIAQGLK